MKRHPIVPLLVFLALAILFTAQFGCGQKKAPDKLVFLGPTGTSTGTIPG